jgi:predicted small integral membrane protein
MLEWMHWTIQVAVLWVAVVVMILTMAILDVKFGSALRTGWLRYPMTRGSRLFLALMVMCVIGILWLKFVRYTYDISMWFALVIALVVGAIIMKNA